MWSPRAPGEPRPAAEEGIRERPRRDRPPALVNRRNEPETQLLNALPQQVHCLRRNRPTPRLLKDVRQLRERVVRLQLVEPALALALRQLAAARARVHEALRKARR